MNKYKLLYRIYFALSKIYYTAKDGIDRPMPCNVCGKTWGH